MMARTHVPIGIATTLLVLPVQSVTDAVIKIGAATIASLIIDADHESSKSNYRLLQTTGALIKGLLCLVVAYLAYKSGISLKDPETLYYAIGILLVLAIPKKYIRFITYGVLAIWMIWKAQSSPDYLWIIYLAPVAIMLAASKHRSVTHSFIGMALMVLAAYMSGLKIVGEVSFAYAFAIGYFAHMAADFFTDKGLPLLWPNERRFKAPLTIETNGMAEKLLEGVASIGCIWLIYNQTAPLLQKLF